ncbi:enoyl-CoA hydratase/isomerase family protein [Candidatus Neomarinimicrobiota bacterium]
MPIEVENIDQFMIIRLTGRRGNAINHDMMSSLVTITSELSNVQGLILTGTGRFFSTGLDIIEADTFEQQEMRTFIDAFDNYLLHIAALPIPTVALLNGHAIGGGLLTTFACDYRIAQPGDYRLVLEQLSLGLSLPAVSLELTRRAVPADLFFKVSTEGISVEPHAALDMGMIQQLAVDPMVAAVKMLSHLSRSPQAYAKFKAHALQPLIDTVAQYGESINTDFVDAWFDPDSAQLRKAAIKRLKKDQPIN